MGRKKISSYSFANVESVTERLKRALKLFELDRAAQVIEQINKNAEENKISHYQFLERLLDEELNKKEDMRIDRWIKQAKFPWLKRLLDYDFEYPQQIDKENVLKLAECEWIQNGGNVIFFGPSGVGKTHLSIALGLEAIERGFETKFVSAERLIEMISVAMGKDREQGGGEHRKKLLSSFVNVQLLILDEFSYSTIAPEVGNFLFQIIYRRHDLQKSLIFTSNEGVDKWESLFAGNPGQTRGALDRLFKDCTAITIKGDSYRQIRLSKKKPKPVKAS